MIAILQYLDTDTTLYKHVGIVRTKREQEFRISPTLRNDRLGDAVPVAYKVGISARALELNNDFLIKSEHTFRLVYFEELQFIALGLRTWHIEFDGQSQRRQIQHYTVKLSFTITPAEFIAYTSPQNLPLSEGGIVIEDSAIYIE